MFASCQFCIKLRLMKAFGRRQLPPPPEVSPEGPSMLCSFCFVMCGFILQESKDPFTPSLLCLEEPGRAPHPWGCSIALQTLGSANELSFKHMLRCQHFCFVRSLKMETVFSLRKQDPNKEMMEWRGFL